MMSTRSVTVLLAIFVLAFTSVSAARAKESGLFLITQDGRFGYIDRSGSIAIAPKFDEAQSFSEGLSVVRIGKRFGYIDEAGNVAIAPRFWRAYAFSEGLARIEVNALPTSYYGYIDRTGRVVIPPQFRMADDFREGRAVVRTRDYSTLRLLDPRGEIAGESSFDDVEAFSSGRAAARRGEMVGYVDRTGRWVVQRTGTESELRNSVGNSLPPYSEGLTAWKADGVYGYIDAEGAWVVSPRFEDAMPFVGGVAMVRIAGKWGMINREATVVAEAKYDWMSRGSEAPLVRLDGRYSALSVTGQELFSMELDAVGPVSEGLAVVAVAGKEGYMDANGVFVIRPQFDTADSFQGGLAKVTLDGYRAYIDRSGRVVWREKSPSHSNWSWNRDW